MLAPSRSLLRYLRHAYRQSLLPPNNTNGCLQARNGTIRTFTSTACASSGHSKWATIKHDKARADAKKNKQRSILAQQIELMVRLYGPDPSTNPRLKTTITDAKRQSLPKEVIESALKRGQGLSTTGKPLETITIEALFPGNVAAIIECATESKAKTLMEVRTALTKHGAAAGVVGYLFRRLGVVTINIQDKAGDAMEILEPVMEVEGFEDFEELEGEEEGTWELLCEPAAVKAVADAVEAVGGVEVKEMSILYRPLEEVDVGGEEREVVEGCVEKLEEMVDVREVYLNMRR